MGEHGGVEKFLVEVFTDEYIGLDVVDGESVIVDFVLYVHVMGNGGKTALCRVEG